jgi:hypothetical protein
MYKMYDKKDILPDGFMYIATRLTRRCVTPMATVYIAYTDSFRGLCCLDLFLLCWITCVRS